MRNSKGLKETLSSIRRIPPDQLPATDAQTLLNHGLMHIEGDLYDVRIVRYRQRDGSFQYDTEPPGEALAEAPGKPASERYNKLPPEIKQRVLRARVIRDTRAGRKLAKESRDHARNRGLKGEAVETDAREYARKAAADLDVPHIEMLTVAMGDVDNEGDLVESENIIPCSWAGER